MVDGTRLESVQRESVRRFKSCSLRQVRLSLNTSEDMEYIFVNGVAGLVAKRYYVAVPLSPKRHIRKGANGKFISK